jgi:5-methylcytosine-specific restriction endonuclease McrA
MACNREAWHRRKHKRDERVRSDNKTGLKLAEYKIFIAERKRARLEAIKLARRKPRHGLLPAVGHTAESKRAYRKAWKIINIATVRAHRANRSKRRRAWLFQVQRGRCAICGQRLGKRTHIDHIVPLALGGSNARSNLQLTHPGCNLAKRARDPFIHAQSLGRLL